MTGSGFPKILVIAVWFGDLPTWFPLWLKSCAFNGDFTWLLLTDATVDASGWPSNVHLARASMSDFRQWIEAAAGSPLSFSHPYKACDCRPIFSGLLHLAPGDWDFWGHCDLDMLFGDLRKFITPDLLSKHDRIFGFGHFSLYRNDEATNNYYRRAVPGVDYREILADENFHGFDEHLGANRLWRAHGGKFYEDESVIIDIDPHANVLRRTSTSVSVQNTRAQGFAFDRGRVLRFIARRSAVHTEEFMYIHFQKRPVASGIDVVDADRVWLTPSGFVPMDDEPVTRARLLELNPAPPLPHPRDALRSMRWRLRLLRRELSQRG